MSVMVAVQTCLLIEGRDVHEVADLIMDHLVVLSETEGSQVLDSAVDADSGADSVTIEVTVEAEDLGAAVNVAIAAMRTAVHATGGNTTDWATLAADSIGDDLHVNRLESVA